MRVELAGMTVPLIVLNELLERLPEDEREKFRARLSPEVLSATYARISRSEKSVDELVIETADDVERARKSNERIIFKLGHHAVADHAMFNFNIIGVSRLVVESIEKRRLAGYTEKSQRYVTFCGDYVRPSEFSAEDLSIFEKLVIFQNNFYFKNNEILFEHLQRKHSGKFKALDDDKKKGEFLKNLEGMAKEDARYSLSLATKTQLGCSYTGQTAELAIRELKYGRLKEEKEFAKFLFDTIVRVAPSLIQLSDAELFRRHFGAELQEDNFKYGGQNLRDLAERTFNKYARQIDHYILPEDFLLGDKNVSLVNYEALIKHFALNKNNVKIIDLNILAALLFTNSKRTIDESYALASLLIEEAKAEDFMNDALKYISEHDKMPREFEVSGLIYAADISSSCFAQLKRHRMNTLLSQDYNPELGVVIPESIIEIGAEQELRDVCNASSELYYEFLPKYGKAAEYCLTNAHKRKVIVATNVRQLYHISRMREDEHAQWEIRQLANKMSRLAKQIAPITTRLLGGKHEFQDVRREVYGE